VAHRRRTPPHLRSLPEGPQRLGGAACSWTTVAALRRRSVRVAGTRHVNETAADPNDGFRPAGL
jgi:hypothetical protein